jgi:hypothetical protein
MGCLEALEKAAEAAGRRKAAAQAVEAVREAAAALVEPAVKEEGPALRCSA